MEPNTTQQTETIFRRLEESVSLFGRQIPPQLWLAVLGVVLLAGFFYAAWMYVRDGRSIGWFWATFLGLLRCSVYCLLAFVFLLPATQTWEESRTQSRVLLVFDGSLSMNTKDDIPTEETPFDKLPTRQDLVLNLVTAGENKFMPRLVAKNPVYAYRFGRFLDKHYQHFRLDGEELQHYQLATRLERDPQDDRKYVEKEKVEPVAEAWARKHWADWLAPKLEENLPPELSDLEREERGRELARNNITFKTTNLGDSLLALLNREGNNMIQGIVVFSDGRTTEGSTHTLREVAERARKQKVPIFVVAVGEDRPRTRIDPPSVRAPRQVRPEDKFPVVVEVKGAGLADQDCPLKLEVSRVIPKEDKDEETEITLVEVRPNGEPIGKEIPLPRGLVMTPPAEPPLKFKPGTIPLARHEFTLDAAALAQLAGVTPTAEGNRFAFKDDKEGFLRLVAVVPKHKNEITGEKEHRSEPVKVRVQKRPLRVLLFAGGPTHEYQFVRTQMVREQDKERAVVCIYIQPAVVGMPARTGRVQDVPKEQLLTAFPHLLVDEKDPSLKPEDKFYNLSAYDLIIAFDPDWSQLSQQQLENVKRWVSDFGGGLIAVGGPIGTVQLARPGENRQKLRPILDLYPVVLKDNRIDDLERKKDEPCRLKFPGVTPDLNFMQLNEDAAGNNALAAWDEFFHGKGATGGDKAPVVRGFFDFYPVREVKPAAQVIATFTHPQAKLEDGKDMPYMVLMPFGSGKTFWLGSGEMRRLRGYHEAYYERFWTKLGRFVGAGSTLQTNRRITLLMDQKFAANEYVQVEARIFGKDMKPLDPASKPIINLTLPQGVLDKEMPTSVEMQPKPGTAESWEGQFVARLLPKAAGEYRLDLRVPETGDTESYKFRVEEARPELDNTRPDYEALYELASEADDVLGRVPEATRKELKARLSRPKVTAEPGDKPADKPAEKDKAAAAKPSEDKPRLYFDLKSATIIPDCMVTEERQQRSRGPVEDWWDSDWPLNRPKGERWFSMVMVIAVGLLSVEWLTRKLLRLA
ncbi:MAG TPA: VWA domain-containing protein [Gemmataceae bacterium]|nr:VWA domain-containing protein [Gemmataceae bacterium]